MENEMEMVSTGGGGLSPSSGLRPLKSSKAAASVLSCAHNTPEESFEHIMDTRFKSHTQNLKHLLPNPPLQTREAALPAFAFATWGQRATLDPSHRVRGTPLAPHLLTRERCPWVLSGDNLLSVYALASANVVRTRLTATELANGLGMSPEETLQLIAEYDNSEYLLKDNNLHRADLARLFNAGVDPKHESINRVGRAVTDAEREQAVKNGTADAARLRRNISKRDKHFAVAESLQATEHASHAAALAFNDATDNVVTITQDELEHCEARRSLVFQHAPDFGEPVENFRFQLPEVVKSRPEGKEVLASACVSIPLVAVPENAGSVVPSTNYVKKPPKWWQDSEREAYLAANPPPPPPPPPPLPPLPPHVFSHAQLIEEQGPGEDEEVKAGEEQSAPAGKGKRKPRKPKTAERAPTAENPPKVPVPVALRVCVPFPSFEVVCTCLDGDIVSGYFTPCALRLALYQCGCETSARTPSQLVYLWSLCSGDDPRDLLDGESTSLTGTALMAAQKRARVPKGPVSYTSLWRILGRVESHVDDQNAINEAVARRNTWERTARDAITSFEGRQATSEDLLKHLVFRPNMEFDARQQATSVTTSMQTLRRYSVSTDAHPLFANPIVLRIVSCFNRRRRALEKIFRAFDRELEGHVDRADALWALKTALAHVDVRHKGTRYPPEEFASGRGKASVSRSTLPAKCEHYLAAKPSAAAKLDRRGITLSEGYPADSAPAVDAPGRARFPRVSFRELVRDASPLLADMEDEKVVAYGIHSTDDSNDSDCLACLSELAHALYHDTYLRWRHELDAAAAGNSPSGMPRAKPWVEVGSVGVLQPWHIADAFNEIAPETQTADSPESVELSREDCMWILENFRGSGDACVDWPRFVYFIAEACDREFAM